MYIYLHDHIDLENIQMTDKVKKEKWRTHDKSDSNTAFFELALNKLKSKRLTIN